MVQRATSPYAQAFLAAYLASPKGGLSSSALEAMRTASGTGENRRSTAPVAPKEAEGLLGKVQKGLEWEPVKRVLDVLSRFSYGSAGVLDDSLKETRNELLRRSRNGDSLDLGDAQAAMAKAVYGDPGDIVREYMEGFSGKDKKFNTEVIRENITQNPWAVYGLGLTLDIATDPTVFIPGSAIAKGAKAVGIGKTGTFSGKKVAEVADDLADIPVPVQDAEAAAQVIARNTEGPTPLPAGSAPRPPIVSASEDVIPGEVVRSFISTLPRELTTGPVIPETTRRNVDLITSQANMRAVADQLQNIRPRRYPRADNGTPINYGNLYRDITPRTFQAGNVAEDVAPVADDVEDAFTAPSEKWARGDLKPENIRKELLKTPGYKLTQGPGTIADLQRAMQAGKVKPELANTLLAKEAQAIAEARRSGKAFGNDRLTVTGDTAPVSRPASGAVAANRNPVQEIVEGALGESRSTRIMGAEYATWFATVGRNFDADDLLYLRKANSAKNFQTRLAKVLEKRVDVPVRSVEDLSKAVREGRLDADDLAGLMELTGRKTPGGVATALTQMQATWLKRLEQFNKSGKAKRGRPKKKVENPATVADEIAYETIEANVTRAEDIVRQIDEGVRVLDEAPVSLSEAQLNDIAEALGTTYRKNQLEPAEWLYQTLRTAAKRTDKTYGKGKARHLNSWNAKFQGDIFRTLIKNANLRVRKANPGLKGKALASAKYDEVMPMLRAIDQQMKAAGMIPRAGVQAANQGHALSIFDVLSIMQRSHAETYMFNSSFSVYADQLSSFAAKMLDNYHAGSGMEGTKSYIRSRLLPTQSPAKNLTPLVKYRLSETTLKRIANGEAILTPKSWAADHPAQNFVNQFVDDFTSYLPQIVQQSHVNAARAAEQLGRATGEITQKTFDDMVAAIRNKNIPEGAKQEMFTVAGQADAVANAARGVENATPEASEAARRLIALRAAELTDDTGRFMAQQQTRLAEGVGEATEVNARIADRILDDVTEYVPMFDMEGNISAALGAGLMKRLYPVGNNLFSWYGHEQLNNMYRNLEGFFTTNAHQFRALMSNLHTDLHSNFGAQTQDVVRAAFKGLQEGRTFEQGTPLAIAAEAINAGPLKHIADNVLVRNGVSRGLINERLKLMGVPEDVLLKGTDNITNAWKRWTSVDDPLNLLDKYYAAIQSALVRVELGAEFSARFGSRTPKPGFVKIAGSGINRSRMLPHIDTTRYYDPEIVKQMRLLDEVIKQADDMAVNNKLIKNFYDPVIQGWKVGMTIYRPGHHIRNLVGDVTLSWLAGVNSVSVYKKALNILLERENRQGWEGLGRLVTPTASTGNTRAATGITVSVNGVKRKIDNDTIYRAARERGILPDYRTLEDTAYGETTQTFFAKLNKKVPFQASRKKIHGAATGISQQRDYYVRLAHFIDILEKRAIKGGDKGIQRAFDDAAQEVRKWHPDGSGLSKFENKYMRRIFMFYSWIRKAIPLVMESTLLTPGKVAVLPKAQYDLAVAMGIEPESISNPFPQDQLFPEFLTEQVTGPTFETEEGYYGIDPGFPTNDVANNYVQKNPINTFISSLTPGLRIPAELSFRERLGGTGAPITDTSDYIDSQIPLVNYASNISNRSVTGLGAPQSNNIEYDPLTGEREVVQNPGMDTVAFLNWLTGMGLKNMSKPNYIERAKQEQYDELARQKRGQS